MTVHFDYGTYVEGRWSGGSVRGWTTGTWRSPILRVLYYQVVIEKRMAEGIQRGPTMLVRAGRLSEIHPDPLPMSHALRSGG